MILQNKVAVVFAASGAIAGQVAKTFSQEGAIVFISGRNAVAIDALADEIKAAGGHVLSASVDALDEAAIDPLRADGADLQDVIMRCTRKAIGELNAI